MGFGGIDKPINNSQIGVSLADLTDGDLLYKLKSLIKNALASTEALMLANDATIENAVRTALSEFKDQLIAPVYFPQRRF